MRLIETETGKAFYLDWDAAQAGLASGAYSIHPDEANAKRGPDNVAAQSPFPGTAPLNADGVVTSADGQFVNLAPIGLTGAAVPQKQFEHAADATPHADQARAEEQAAANVAAMPAGGAPVRVIVDTEAMKAEEQARLARFEAVEAAAQRARDDDGRARRGAAKGSTES